MLLDQKASTNRWFKQLNTDYDSHGSPEESRRWAGQTQTLSIREAWGGKDNSLFSSLVLNPLPVLGSPLCEP